MKVSDLFNLDANFHKEEEVKQFIVHSKNYQADKESPDDTNALIIFQT